MPERQGCGADPGPEEHEAVDLGENQVGRQEGDALPRRPQEELLRFDMMLVARAQQRDPGTAVNEDAGAAS